MCVAKALLALSSHDESEAENEEHKKHENKPINQSTHVKLFWGGVRGVAPVLITLSAALPLYL